MGHGNGFFAKAYILEAYFGIHRTWVINLGADVMGFEKGFEGIAFASTQDTQGVLIPDRVPVW